VFYYFGRKGRAAKTYPAPEYPLVIEPFAGSMAYSLHWRPPFAIGIEAQDSTWELWHRLCDMSAEEIRDFACPEVGEESTDRWVLQAATSNWNDYSTYRTVTHYMVEHFHQQRRMTLRHHDYAKRSVLYSHGDYRSAPDVEATWFIDPPYVGVRGGCREKDIDYDELAEWTMARKGQLIVCEGYDGTWLPFKHHGEWRGAAQFGQSANRIVETVLTRRTHGHCVQCGTTFPASRADARYCSARCRKRASRAAK
jgi:hypothetical protein